MNVAVTISCTLRIWYVESPIVLHERWNQGVTYFLSWESWDSLCVLSHGNTATVFNISFICFCFVGFIKQWRLGSVFLAQTFGTTVLVNIRIVILLWVCHLLCFGNFQIVNLFGIIMLMRGNRCHNFCICSFSLLTVWWNILGFCFCVLLLHVLWNWSDGDIRQVSDFYTVLSSCGQVEGQWPQLVHMVSLQGQL